jgi:adenylate cyclase
MEPATHATFRFAEYTLDVLRGSLRTADREVELRPKSFEVLCYLVENAGRVVTKEELIKAVWPDVVVTEESLTRCVSDVRNAIGDGAQAMIKTVPRRGYRFAAPVLQLDATPAATRVPQIQAGAAREFGPLRDRPSIAVLPFVNLSGDAQQEYFSDGITEDIITELSRFSELLVIARNSTFQHKGKSLDIRQIGRELGARYVMEGSIRRDGDRVRITAQLIDAVSGAHRWAERYDREIKDVFAIQDEVARTIVALLAAHVNKAEAERTLLKPPATWEAYDCYMRGADICSLHSRTGVVASLYEARRLLEQSLAIDPAYARAYAMLSWTHWWTYVEPLDSDYLNPVGLDRALELAKKAVQLDPDLPQAHAQLGWILVFTRRHEEAIAAFERAFALNPNFVNNRFALTLIFAGQPATAVNVLQANTRLDPFQRDTWLGFMANACYMLKRYREAVPLLREYGSRAPNVQIVHIWLAAAYAQLGQLAEARMEAAEVLRMNPDFTIARWKVTAVYKNPEDAEHLLDGLRKAGLPEK